MTARLAGGAAIVTGAASARGIGLASARRLAEFGARVLITDIDLAAAAEAASILPGDGHLGARCDVTDAAQCRAAACCAQMRHDKG